MRPNNLISTALMFQSLFFWNGLWDGDQGSGCRMSDNVSILVFLEWPLGHDTGYDPQDEKEKFQSLFFWNGLWDRTSGGCIPSIIYCFNPCFSGMAFGTPSGTSSPGGRPYVSILVFLEWPLGLGTCEPAPVTVGGFNPCFSGMAFGTSYRSIRAFSAREFQSLFFWNGLWDAEPHGRRNRRG